MPALVGYFFAFFYVLASVENSVNSFKESFELTLYSLQAIDQMKIMPLGILG
jgi:hypothetical protein